MDAKALLSGPSLTHTHKGTHECARTHVQISPPCVQCVRVCQLTAFKCAARSINSDRLHVCGCECVRVCVYDATGVLATKAPLTQGRQMIAMEFPDLERLSHVEAPPYGHSQFNHLETR